MGPNNRMRRAAKQHKRHRAEHSRHTGGWSPTPPDDDVVARQLVGHARLQRRQGVAVAECVRPLLALPVLAIDKAVDSVFGDVLRATFAGGWTPLDLAEIGRRRLDAMGALFLLDAVVAVTADYPAALVDARWRAHLDVAGGTVWWDDRRPTLSQWADHWDVGHKRALAVMIHVLGVIDGLPRVEQVLPPPGAPPKSASAPTLDSAHEKVLAKVRGLLAKAESTDFDDEAQALSAKAQELMACYALHRALADDERGVRQEASMRRIWLDNPYVAAKGLLVHAVASANRCRTVLAAQTGHITVIGDEIDLELVEVLATSLLLQGTRAMLSAGAQVSRRSISHTRSYRQSFLVAYASRIGERLRTANAVGAPAAETDRLLPVLSARSRAVDDLIERQFPSLVAKNVSVSNSAGWGAGRVAADLARLDVRGALGAAG